MLAGGVCGILGFGGIGAATAKLMRGVGMRVHAINRRGAGHEAVDWMGTPDRLDELLAAADVLVLSLPLTPRSEEHTSELQSLMRISYAVFCLKKKNKHKKRPKIKPK